MSLSMVRMISSSTSDGLTDNIIEKRIPLAVPPVGFLYFFYFYSVDIITGWW